MSWRDLSTFRNRLNEVRRPSGRSQRELARALGVHPTVLSHKLHGTDKAYLTHAEVKAIVRTLAEWQAIVEHSQAIELLALMSLGERSFTDQEWDSLPIKLLARPLLTSAGDPDVLGVSPEVH